MLKMRAADFREFKWKYGGEDAVHMQRFVVSVYWKHGALFDIMLMEKRKAETSLVSGLVWPGTVPSSSYEGRRKSGKKTHKRKTWQQRARMKSGDKTVKERSPKPATSSPVSVGFGLKEHTNG